MKTRNVTIRLDAQALRELGFLSRELGRSRSDVIRDALNRKFATAPNARRVSNGEEQAQQRQDPQ